MLERHSGLSRRDFLKLSGAGALECLPVWLDECPGPRAATEGTKHKSCILLWMDGGPSHKDTFDLKPGTKDGGEFKPIADLGPRHRRSASTSRSSPS